MPFDNDFNKSPKIALTYFYIKEGIIFIISLMIYIAVYLLWLNYHWFHFLIYILILLGILSLLRLIFKPLIQYHYRFYKVLDGIIESKQTFIFKHLNITKVERLQYLQLHTNPLTRYFNLYEVIFVTAGHRMVLPLISQQQAKQIEQSALEYLGGADFDV